MTALNELINSIEVYAIESGNDEINIDKLLEVIRDEYLPKELNQLEQQFEFGKFMVQKKNKSF